MLPTGANSSSASSNNKNKGNNMFKSKIEKQILSVSERLTKAMAKEFMLRDNPNLVYKSVEKSLQKHLHQMQPDFTNSLQNKIEKAARNLAKKTLQEINPNENRVKPLPPKLPKIPKK
jgi:hypothetical protein